MAALCLPAMAGSRPRRRETNVSGRRVVVWFRMRRVRTGRRTLACYGFAALRFLEQGSLMMGCPTWSLRFNRKRGTALGLMTLGFGI